MTLPAVDASDDESHTMPVLYSLRRYVDIQPDAPAICSPPG